MIVTCEKCSTRFELDDARIPVTGAQLRCSKCKHSFFLAHPSTSLEDSVHAIAEEAAGDLSVGVPDPSADLAGASDALGDDEEDWEFSEEIRMAGDDEEAGADVLADDAEAEIFDEGFDESGLTEDVSGDHSQMASSFAGTAEEIAAAQSVLDVDEADHSGLELDGESPAAAAGAEAAVEAGHDSSSFGEVDDFTSWMEDDEPDSVGQPLDTQVAPASAAATVDREGRAEASSWDLAPDADAAPRDDALSAADSLAAAIDGEQVETPPAPTAYHDELNEPSALYRGLAKTGSFAGWAIAIPVMAYAAFLAFEAEWLRWEPLPQTFVSGALTAETTNVTWVETAWAGSLLVMDGVVHNSGNEVLSLEGLQVSVLNTAGEPIVGSVQMIGSPLPEEVLREAPLEMLSHSLAAAHEELLTHPVAPGQARSFQTVVSELPEGASRLLIEKVSGR